VPSRFRGGGGDLRGSSIHWDPALSATIDLRKKFKQWYLQKRAVWINSKNDVRKEGAAVATTAGKGVPESRGLRKVKTSCPIV